MTVTVDDLITPTTDAESLTTVYGWLSDLGVPVTGWAAGARMRTLMSVVAKMYTTVTTVANSISKSAFMSYSADEWLTLTAKEVYNVDRITATFAVGEVTFTNSGGGTYTVDAYDVTVKNTESGKTYRNTEAFTLTATGTPTASATVGIEATEIGAASSCAASKIDELVTTMLGVSVTNAAEVVGNDEESDDALKARAAQKLESLSPDGPANAYHYVATSATNAAGENLGVTRSKVNKGGFGTLEVVVASAAGEVSGNANTRGTPLGDVNYAIQTQVVPLGIGEVTVVSATPKVVNIVATLYVVGNSTLSANSFAALKSLVYDSSNNIGTLVDFFRTHPLGGYLLSGFGYMFHEMLTTAISSAHEDIFHVVVSTPASNVVLADNEVAVLGTVTLTATGVVQ